MNRKLPVLFVVSLLFPTFTWANPVSLVRQVTPGRTSLVQRKWEILQGLALLELNRIEASALLQLGDLVDVDVKFKSGKLKVYQLVALGRDEFPVNPELMKVENMGVRFAIDLVHFLFDGNALDIDRPIFRNAEPTSSKRVIGFALLVVETNPNKPPKRGTPPRERAGKADLRALVANPKLDQAAIQKALLADAVSLASNLHLATMEALIPETAVASLEPVFAEHGLVRTAGVDAAPTVMLPSDEKVKAFAGAGVKFELPFMCPPPSVPQ